jgi:threonyl-tRNA synthetase
MKGLGLDQIISYRFSKRDPNNKEKYFPDDALWDKAESMMKSALDEIGISYTEAEDEAAFYGPKLDVQATNVNGKEDTLFTAQIDFLLPEKFGIEYVDKEGKKVRPVMIHRSAIGALERTFAFLIEHYAGAFPTWLSPVQVAILPVSETHDEYAKNIVAKLKEAGIRVEFLESGDSLGKRIRSVKTSKVPYFVVIGDKEKDSGNLTIENRMGDKEELSADKLIEKLETEIKNRA